MPDFTWRRRNGGERVSTVTAMPTLEFKGKQHIYAHHLTVPHRPLIVDPAKSFPQQQNRGGGTPVLSSALPDDNLIIHGDNLHALKALLPRYAGKVNCIYIDPPYNTGNEGWTYSDRVNSPLLREWFKVNNPIDGEDEERHEKWLCMMWPRIQLLRELLSDDGIIFASIDDNEIHHLRMLLDETFGPRNSVGCITWHRKRGKDNSAKFLSRVHEYVLVYAKNIATATFRRLALSENTLQQYNNPDNDSRGPYRRLGLWRRGGQGGSDSFGVSLPNGVTIQPRQWLVNEETMRTLVDDNRVLAVGENLYRKLFLSEHGGSIPDTIWLDTSNTANATDMIKSIFGSSVFATPKPVELISRMLQLATPTDGIILDSFAGSGTTAQATLALNAEDGGARRFILVELEDYANTVTAERVRRVIKGVSETKDQRLRDGLGGSFTYCTLGEPLDLETMLRGDSLPPYAELAAYLLYTATGVSVDGTELERRDGGWFFGDESMDYYLFYEPDLEWLQSNEAVFTEDQAKRIRAAGPGRSAVVFAAGKFIGQRELSRMNITFCQLPYELHRAGG